MDLDRTKLIRWWALVRWFMAVVMFSIGMLHINFSETFYQSMVFLGTFAGIVALNLLFHLQSSILRPWTVVFQIVLDIVYATIIVHLTGGPASSFVWVYIIAVITASLTVPKSGGVMAGLVGSLSLLTLTVMYKNDILTQPGYSHLDVAGSTIYILSYTGLFCGVALVANYLSDQLGTFAALRRDLVELRSQVASLEDMLAASKTTVREWEELKPLLRDIAQLDHDLNTPLCVISLSLGRITKLGIESNNEGLQRSGNEITDALNKISQLLLRLDSLKKNRLVEYK
ncbi:MAG: hypothetical protein U1C33_06795 [Candidatus Cloacimonadaceae bacterium]|nr:hypothetical protein [Candidatus Cloacimonadaceae bacterium]